MVEEFMGFERPKGKVGIRNKVMILSSVVCINHVTQEISKKVENSTAITHPLGCGQFAVDFTNIQRTLSGLGANPVSYVAIYENSLIYFLFYVIKLTCLYITTT